MRITQGMLSSNMLLNLMNSQSKMDTYLEQLYTGKKISRPSDDPVIAMKAINYRTQVAEVEQYKRNMGEVHNWMDNSDAALDKATQAMHRVRELSIQASNSTYGDEERQSIKEEIAQLKQYLIDVANTNVNGKYIFNGTNTEEPPFNQDGSIADSYITTPVQIEVSKGIEIQVNVNVADIFGVSEIEDENGDIVGVESGLFAAIDRLIDKLDSNGDPEEQIDIGSSLEELDNSVNDLINGRANLGAQMNRVELIENRLDDQKVIATKTMSDNEDIHFEEAITNLITQESLHRAALAAGSRVIQPTLIDFLR